MPSEISIPFRLDANGSIAVETGPNEQIRQHVMSLINTQPGERAMVQDYGVPLADLLFEEDVVVTAEMPDLIRAAFAKWEPGVKLLSVTPQGTSDPMDGIAQVGVQYQRADAPDTPIAGSTTNVALVSPGGAVTEVVRG